MPRRGECRKTVPYFPKKYEEVVGHIQTEADFFTPSHERRARALQNDLLDAVVSFGQRFTKRLVTQPPF
jgi:hypothetical protein